jgi:hypothetical protein
MGGNISSNQQAEAPHSDASTKHTHCQCGCASGLLSIRKADVVAAKADVVAAKAGVVAGNGSWPQHTKRLHAWQYRNPA